MLRVFDGYLPEDLLRFSPVALEGHHHRDLVPDVAEALVVVGDGISEDLAVRDMNDPPARLVDRKSTRLNSSHSSKSYAVLCLKKKTMWLTSATKTGTAPQTHAQPTRHRQAAFTDKHH